MPCQQCDNGKWKWGETGECQYDSEEECKAAHPEPHRSDEQQQQQGD